MLPVTYESHCRSCHPLKFDPRSPNGEMRHGLTRASFWENFDSFMPRRPRTLIPNCYAGSCLLVQSPDGKRIRSSQG